MRGLPHHIHLRPDVRPYAVPATEPQYPITSMMKSGDSWTTTSVKALLKRCLLGSPKSGYSGYHQIPLDYESRKLTTFIAPWGRFRYCRTPMGHCAAQDALTKRFDDIITDTPRKLKCVDDTLLHDRSIVESFWHTYDLLQRCMEDGVTLRPDNFSLCKRSVTFAGYLLGWKEYQPSHDFTRSIMEFTIPSSLSLTDIRSWFGIVN
ncbi:hypothetical protein Pcinc_017902 [Petrolisthes cinctipes]|uniref:Reverse transcriptase n=1 Tax=Petrolisthes cinctipes TaxID=88211 RepID=A0AAE1KPE9_PETCI|nr:hypothetical protein Pcinc_017902 [Petrolisthes cinctipes]